MRATVGLAVLASASVCFAAASVLEALKRNDWNVTRSAEETGMQRANFQALMKKYDIRIRGIEPDPGGAAVG